MKKDKLIKAKFKIAEALKDTKMGDVHAVDFKIPFGRLKAKDIIEVGKLKDVWGNQIDCPQFAITNITVPTSDIQIIGDKRNVIKFKKDDITFIKFFANEAYRDAMIKKDKNSFGKSAKAVTMTTIGEFEINEYEGREYPQINIIDFESKKKEDVLF